MKDFFLLVKAISSNSAVRVRQKKGKTVVSRSSLLPLVFAAAVLILVFAARPLFNILAFRDAGVPNDALFTYTQCLVASFLFYGFFMGCCNSVTVFFSCWDDVFLPLPIKGGRLFMARYVLALFRCFLYTILPLLALMIGGSILSSLPPVSVFLAVLVSLFSAFSISSLAFMFVAFFFFVFRIRKEGRVPSILSTVFSLIAMVGLFLIGFLQPVGETTEAIASSIENMYDTFFFLNWISYLPCRSLLVGNGISLLFFFLVLLIALLSVSLAVFVGNRFYRPSLVYRGRKKRKKKDEVGIFEKTERSFLLSYRHPLLFQIKREIDNYRNHGSLFVSSLVGSVSFIVSLVIIIPVVLSLDSGGAFPENLVFLFLFAMVMTSIFQPYFTFASVSLEGQSILLLKTYPFNRNTYLLAKIFLGSVFSTIVGFVMMLTFSILQHIGIAEILVSLLCLLAYATLSNLVSLLFGIRFAVFSFDSSMEILHRGWGPRLVSLVLFFAPVPSILLVAIVSLYLPDYLFVGPLLSFFLHAGLAFLFFHLCRKALTKMLQKDMPL